MLESVFKYGTIRPEIYSPTSRKIFSYKPKNHLFSQFCMGNNLPFLAVRVWIGIWIFVISFTTAMFEGSFLVRFVSRFTQEIFAALISLIFIYETFNKLARVGVWKYISLFDTT